MNCFDLNLNINSLHLRYMSLEQTYNLTFTAGALLMNETCAVAEVFVESGYNWEITKERAFKENLMEKDKVSTNKRFFSLVKQRIEALNETELDMLVSGNNSIRRLLLLLAICKAHALVFDFIFVNVRECFFNMQEKVTHANFNEFFNEKKYIHPELESITDLTVNKIRRWYSRYLNRPNSLNQLIQASCDDLIYQKR